MRFWVVKENDQIPKNEWDGAYQVSINRDTASSAFSSIPAIWYHLDQLQLEPIYEDLYIIGLSVFSLDKSFKIAGQGISKYQYPSWSMESGRKQNLPVITFYHI